MGIMALQEEVILIVVEDLAEVVEMVEVVEKVINFALIVDKPIIMLIVAGKNMDTLHICKLHKSMVLLIIV
jgi:hypothetical protein